MSQIKQAPPGITLLLAALASLGPFAIDTYLPSFQDIGANLGASPVEVQQTLSAYMLPFSIMALWHGALADTFGRRKVVLISLTCFCLAMFASIFATRIEHLWILRAIQGMSAGSGVVVSRAIVRDLFDGAEAQRQMARITMMFAFAPAIAPLVGGQLQAWFGWRSVFGFLAVMSFVLCVVCWFLLPETLPPERRQSLHPRYLLRSYWKVLSSRPFLFSCGALTFNFAGFFVYIMSAPVFLMQHLQLPATSFLWLFGPAMSGLALGSWFSGKMAGKASQGETIRRAYRIMGVAVLLNLTISFALPPGVPWSVLPIFVYTFGMSIAAPSLTLMALDPFPEQRGLAASCQMFLQTLGNSLLAGVVAPLLWGSTRSLGLGMGAFVLTGLIFTLSYFRFRAKAKS